MRYAVMIGAILLSPGVNAKAAAPDQTMTDALGEVAGELQVCATYFLILSQCVEKQEPALSRQYRAMSDQTADLAIAGSRVAGVSVEAYIALSSLEAEQMMRAMRNSCTNIAVLLRKYMNFCKRITADTDTRLQEWVGCLRGGKRSCGAPN